MLPYDEWIATMKKTKKELSAMEIEDAFATATAMRTADLMQKHESLEVATFFLAEVSKITRKAVHSLFPELKEGDE